MRRPMLIFLCFVLATAITSPAQIFTKLADFDGSNGLTPICTLIQASDGNFYGTTFQGGADNYGTAFKVTPDGTLTTLYSFDNVMGADPFSGVVQGTDGNFYGTSGGGANNSGTVFEITPEGTLTTLYNFCSLMNCADGKGPYGLVQGTDGNFYGATYFGGTNNFGTVFKITPGGALTTLHSFEFYTDGAYPSAALVRAADGNFYGTTSSGGAHHAGTVFKITPEETLTTLYSFCSEQNCHDGADPEAVLVQAMDGNFYGTTHSGGANDYGTVFKITPAGMLTTLHSFDFYTDGAHPLAGLVQATDGNFYGTTNGGGSANCGNLGCGTLFTITPEGTLTTLHSFYLLDGGNPYGGLVQGTDGDFYGTTDEGGDHDAGTVFRLDAGLALLAVTKVGSGTVFSGDGHIYCGSVCSYTYDGGTQVGLTAIPAPGYTFSGWTGCDKAQGSFCTMMMSSAKNVTATFTTSNVGLTSLVLNPSSVKGGNISIATISLNAPAPPGGLGVGVATNSPLAVHPPSLVLVPEGRTSYSFAVRTSVVRMNTVASVIASVGASQVNATLTVTTGYGSSQAPASGPLR